MGIKRKPSHQICLTQRHYQSTRKKRKVESKTFNKPSSELSIYQENLVKAEEVCEVCFKQDDDDTQENINWICCNRCGYTINVLMLKKSCQMNISMYANSAIIFKTYLIMLEIFLKLINICQMFVFLS